MAYSSGESAILLLPDGTSSENLLVTGYNKSCSWVSLQFQKSQWSRNHYCLGPLKFGVASQARTHGSPQMKDIYIATLFHLALPIINVYL